MKKICFFLNNIESRVDNLIENGFPSHHMYASAELYKQGKAKVIDNKKENIKKIPKNSIVIVDGTKYVPRLKKEGHKVVVISINSNHDLSQNKMTPKGLYLYNLYKYQYKKADLVICLSKVQEPSLLKIGVKKAVTIPLGVDNKPIEKEIIGSKYFLSPGGDIGKQQEMIKQVSKKNNIRIIGGRGYPLLYKEYIKELANCKAIVLNINTNKKRASDLSGTTTCFEALLMKKPIIINNVPWLKELFKKNYFVYNSKDELETLLKKDIKFIEIDYSYLTLDHFSKRLLEEIEYI
jgi:hypothetical protein